MKTSYRHPLVWVGNRWLGQYTSKLRGELSISVDNLEKAGIKWSNHAYSIMNMEQRDRLRGDISSNILPICETRSSYHRDFTMTVYGRDLEFIARFSCRSDVELCRQLSEPRSHNIVLYWINITLDTEQDHQTPETSFLGLIILLQLFLPLSFSLVWLLK